MGQNEKCVTDSEKLIHEGSKPCISFHFSLFNHGSPVNLLRLLCRGPCKKIHNQKSKTYFTIILTEITEIKIFLTEIKQVQ